MKIMETTKLSSKGQVIISKALRDAYRWKVGQELIVIDTGDGILFKLKQSFPKIAIDEVAGCLECKGKAKTLEEINDAIDRGMINQWQ
jgi:AbrB family looped-hinge helix DNA binding protein